MLHYAREVIDVEIAALRQLRDLLDDRFVAALDLICAAKGRLVLSGMGKAGLIARKISATLASTGTPSFTLHPAEAAHGDLGMLDADDVCLVISNSGESDEIARMLLGIRQIGAKIIAITGNARSTLATQADLTLWLGDIKEACPLGLAPTASTTAMLALGDALAMGLMRRKNFQLRDYAVFHPGGALGKKAAPIRNFMRRGANHAVVAPTTTVAATLLAVTNAHSGAATVVNAGDGTLAGIFCDGDLRRSFQHPTGDVLSQPVEKFMTAPCASAHEATPAGEILAVMRQKRIAEIPIVDDDGKVVGMADMKSLLNGL
ncbi:arabinose-5-phosphate isomerase [Planctomycetales bacterium]|nr:arabinose-5-phosphate isomerase [Planctomycetales bacterium]